jgi:hypothetical protein
MAFNVAAFITKHAAEIAEIKAGLLNFDIPAQRTINAGFARMNVARFVGKDDRWEQITCHQNGWEYKQIPPEIMNRWARY